MTATANSKKRLTTIVSNIERGLWTAAQVLEPFIAQSLIAHSATNCITEVLFDHARQRAKELDAEFKKTNCLKGPLHGVPISVKVYNMTGVDTTIGYTSCANHPAQFTADFVQSMVDAGAVPFVKTNVPQTMFAYECSNPMWGRTCNPYNTAYSCGGSSGGEACMLALDASVIGLGSDIGGSLRIPAAYCGIYSIKPTSFPGMDGIKSVCGPLARCMEDLELACRVSFGAPGVYNDHPPLPFHDVDLPKKLRFGYYTSDGVLKASPACMRAVKQTIDALESAGHDCIELDQHLAPEIMLTYHKITCADGYKTLLKEKGSDPLDTSLSVLTFGPKVPQFIRSAVAWAIAMFVGDKVMADVVRFWHKYNLDGILTNVHASPQTIHGGSKNLSMMSTPTFTYNLVDSPVGVIPVAYVDASLDSLTNEWKEGPGHGSSMCESELYYKTFKDKKPIYDPVAMDGMPIGLQIVGKVWEDEKVLAMMKMVDEVLGKQRGFGPGTWEQRLQNRKRT
ncbi:amidase signature domain-containing protein [Mycena vitilis]|nr:amidase signature domain-containing protein [Mycena vitilis]